MTTRYFDSVNGADGNDGLTPETAKQTYNPNSTSSGDTILFKRGATQTVTTAFQWIREGISEAQRTRFGAYGEAQVPYSIWKYGAASGGMILNAAKSRYVDFEDMYFDMTGANCSNSVYCASQGAVETFSNTFRRCTFKGSGNTSHFGNGLQIVQESTSTVHPHDYLIEDCEFFDNETHGLFICGGKDIIVRNCRFYRNGSLDPNGGHGFSSRWNRTDATTGWTLHSGTIWKKTLAAAELDVYYVQTSVASYLRVRKTAGVQTAPAVGEYGVSAGVLYINLNDGATNPGTQGVRYAWGRCSGIIVTGCVSYNNYWNQAAPFREGHGFAFDDFTEDSQFLSNIAYDNEGVGFSINRGDRNLLTGNIAYGNWSSGIVANPCDDLTITHNTFYNNNAGLSPLDGEITTFGFCKRATITNNILKATSKYSVSSEANDTDYTGTKNCMHGFTTSAEKTAFVTATVNEDPLLDSAHRPLNPNLHGAGASVGGTDCYGRVFSSTPSIGAVEQLTKDIYRTLRGI